MFVRDDIIATTSNHFTRTHLVYDTNGNTQDARRWNAQVVGK